MIRILPSAKRLHRSRTVWHMQQRQQGVIICVWTVFFDITKNCQALSPVRNLLSTAQAHSEVAAVASPQLLHTTYAAQELNQ